MKLSFVGILTLVIGHLILSSFTEGKNLSDKYLEVVMRSIGNKVLWAQGDSTSSVLPVESTKDKDVYTISFEKPIQITSDSLYNIVTRELKRVEITSFVAELKQCGTNDVILAFINTSPTDSIQPCRGRETPADCYQIVITILQKEPINQMSTILIALLGLSAIFFLYKKDIFMRGTKNKPKTDKETTSISLGKYTFDVEGSQLWMDNEATPLTDRETKLLMLLLKSVHQPVSRDILMEEIWGESGVLVISRNIDVLVSKLRKKLSKDEDIKITNVHAVGYKLEV
jgi:hypothetical protein